MELQLKALRQSRGITQAVLSKALNISPSTVGMWEQGRREPNYGNLKRIAAYFGVSIDTLLGSTDKCTFTEEQIKLLKTYESLDIDGQDIFKNFIKSLQKVHARNDVQSVQLNNACKSVIDVGSNNSAIWG